VNRSLHLEKIKFFGFDMDYTLAGSFVIIPIRQLAVSAKCRVYDAFFHMNS